MGPHTCAAPWLLHIPRPRIFQGHGPVPPPFPWRIILCVYSMLNWYSLYHGVVQSQRHTAVREAMLYALCSLLYNSIPSRKVDIWGVCGGTIHTTIIELYNCHKALSIMPRPQFSQISYAKTFGLVNIPSHDQPLTESSKLYMFLGFPPKWH